MSPKHILFNFHETLLECLRDLLKFHQIPGINAFGGHSVSILHETLLESLQLEIPPPLNTPPWFCKPAARNGSISDSFKDFSFQFDFGIHKMESKTLFYSFSRNPIRIPSRITHFPLKFVNECVLGHLSSILHETLLECRRDLV